MKVRDNYFRNAVLARIKDGDTIVADVDLGFSVWSRQTFRLYGIQAPEKNTREGRAAASYLESIIKPDEEIILEIIRSPSGKESRTFGRYVAIPWALGIMRSSGSGEPIPVDVCEMMIEFGHAKRWTKFKRYKRVERP